MSTASSSVVDLQTVDHMTSVHCVRYQHEGTEKYAFINGQVRTHKLLYSNCVQPSHVAEKK